MSLFNWERVTEVVLIEGLYKFLFSTPRSEGSGICVFKTGHIVGGGDIVFGVGTYKENGNHVSGDVHAMRHARAGKPSPILGLDEFHLHLDGLIYCGFGLFSATIAEAPDILVHATLKNIPFE